MEGIHYCGVRENFGESMQVKLPTNTPTWFFQGSIRGIDNATVRATIQKALDSWSKHCIVRFTEAATAQAATLRIITERIDGSGRVLADCQLPFPGMKQLLMRLDDERFVTDLQPSAGTIGLRHVVAHEAGHALSLGHLPFDNTPDLMNPTYAAGVFEPQADEATIVRRIYGAPVDVNGIVLPKITVTLNYPDGTVGRASGQPTIVGQ